MRIPGLKLPSDKGDGYIYIYIFLKNSETALLLVEAG